jgi:hypothetical protein
MRAIVTDEQRRSRTEAGLPSIYFASLKRGDSLRKVWALLRGERRCSSVAYSRISGSAAPGAVSSANGRYAPSSLLVAPQNRPDHCQGICETLH